MAQVRQDAVQSRELVERQGRPLEGGHDQIYGQADTERCISVSLFSFYKTTISKTTDI